MIAFGHTAVGVIVGVSAFKILGSGDLVTGLITTGTAGVISHYVTDFIPHGHFSKMTNYKKQILPIILFDLFFSVLLFLTISYYQFGLNEALLYVMFGIGSSQLPDVIDGLMYINVLKKKGLLKLENDFHQWLHWHGRGPTTLILGTRDIWQVLVVLVACGILILV